MLDSLANTKLSLLTYAKQLDRPYEEYSIDELANRYCEAVDKKDTQNKNIYISALVLRFWYTIDKTYKKSLSAGLEREDFLAWLYEAIEYACKYRAWQKKKNVNAQQAINQCIETIRLQHFYKYNLDRSKINYNTHNLVNLDMVINENGDTIGDQYADPDSFANPDTSAESLVQELINRNKIVEAIIVDNMAFKDVFKYTKETVKTYDYNTKKYKKSHITNSTFWPYKLVQELNTIDDKYTKYFATKYSIESGKLIAAITTMGKATNSKKYKYIKDTINKVKLDPTLTALLQ